MRNDILPMVDQEQHNTQLSSEVTGGVNHSTQSGSVECYTRTELSSQYSFGYLI